MDWLTAFINGFNLGLIKKLFGKKAQNISPTWQQAYADAIGIKVMQLTNEQKKLALLEHVLRNTDCFEDFEIRIKKDE